MTKIRCKKCNDIIEGDRKGTFIQCSCGACYIDETEHYVRVGGNPNDIEEIRDVIMTLEEKENAIINNYGVISQLKYFQSEIFEMNEAIIRYEQFLRDNERGISDSLRDNIMEEIADVQLMLNQFKRYYGIPDNLIKVIMNKKADRQLKRIEEEGKKYE